MNDNQHNIAKIIKANKILDDTSRVYTNANIKYFKWNSNRKNRDRKLSATENKIINTYSSQTTINKNDLLAKWNRSNNFRRFYKYISMSVRRI